MTKFTKGEWEVFGDWGIRAKKSERQLCENTCHATFEYDRGTSEEGFANAHLISQSPAMYAMIESLSRELELAITKINIDINRTITPQTETQPDLWDMESLHDAQVLLAKCRGE